MNQQEFMGQYTVPAYVALSFVATFRLEALKNETTINYMPKITYTL